MKKYLFLLLMFCVCTPYISAFCQINKQNGVNIEEISKKIFSLSKKNDPDSRNQLQKKAIELSKSNEESLVHLSIWIYNHLEDESRVMYIENLLLKKFPYGDFARYKAFDNLFKDESLSANDLEVEYKKIVENFPIQSFPIHIYDVNTSQYVWAMAKLASQFYKEDNFDKGNEYFSRGI